MTKTITINLTDFVEEWSKIAAGTHTIKIKSRNETQSKESSFSIPIQFTKAAKTKLTTPANVSLNGTEVKTDPVENATTYKVVDAGGDTVGSYTPGGTYDYEEQDNVVIIRNAPYTENDNEVIIT